MHDTRDATRHNQAPHHPGQVTAHSHWTRYFLGLIAMFLMTGCTSLSLAVVNVPTWFSDLTVDQDLVFDPETGLALDLYRPGIPNTDARHPVVVFFYGGSWQEGDKVDYRFVAASLAAQGYLVAVPNYRKSPTVGVSGFMADAARATRWVFDHAERYQGDPGRFFLMGHSAGGHMAALLGIDKSWLEAVGLRPDQVTGVVGLAGPYDFTPRAEDIRRVFADAPDNATHLSRLVTGDEPPMLLQYGLADEIVAAQNHERLSAALTTHDICHQVITYEGLDHADMVSAFSWIYRDKRPVFADTLAFLVASAGRRNGDCSHHNTHPD
ncbi:MAG: alpha/beta hydrolase [Pseudomonadota bacterium]